MCAACVGGTFPFVGTSTSVGKAVSSALDIPEACSDGNGDKISPVVEPDVRLAPLWSNEPVLDSTVLSSLMILVRMSLFKIRVFFICSESMALPIEPLLTSSSSISSSSVYSSFRISPSLEPLAPMKPVLAAAPT